jgi:hypothetical protein
VSRGDDLRQQRIAEDIAELRLRAESASNELSRTRFLRAAAKLEKAQRWQRIYPFSGWLNGACLVVVMLSWALRATRMSRRWVSL